jgi:hypothetical protein
MHIAVRRYSAEPELFNDLKQRIEGDFVPDLKRIDGFAAYYVVVTGSETFDTISCFETADGEKKSTQLAADFVKRAFPGRRIERVTVDEGPCIIEQHAPVHA